MPLRNGQTLQNRYQILHPLGQGGMGAVYLAQDGRLNTNQSSSSSSTPLPHNNLVDVSPLRLNPGPQLHNGYTYLGELLLANGLTVNELFYNQQSPASVRQAQANALSHAPDAYLVVTWDAALRHAQTGDTSQEELVAALLATGRPVIVVFGTLPYDQMRLSHAPTQIMMYGDTDGQIEGVVALLLGP